VITGESFAPKTKSHQSTFRSIGEVANVVFSAAIAGRVFARHGTSIDTRLTVIDKKSAGDGVAKTDVEDVYHPLCETTDDLLATVLALLARVMTLQNLRHGSICMHCVMRPAKKLVFSPPSAPSIPSTASMPVRLCINQKSG
jgi:hypothetical protein